jgi:hypothetical protein
VKLDLSRSWDVLLNDQPVITFSTPNASGGPPPELVYSSVTYDAYGNFRVDGGGLAILNASENEPMAAVPLQNLFESRQDSRQTLLNVCTR